MHGLPRSATLGPMTLPSQVHLAPHRSVLPRGARSRQLGLDPDRAVTVDGLDPPLALMLDELADPADPAALVERAVRRGADAGAATDALARLLEIGVLVDAGPAPEARGARWPARHMARATRRGRRPAATRSCDPLARWAVTKAVPAAPAASSSTAMDACSRPMPVRRSRYSWLSD